VRCSGDASPAWVKRKHPDVEQRLELVLLKRETRNSRARAAATGRDGCSATHRQIASPRPGAADAGSRATICIDDAIGAKCHERDARPMHQPVIALVDPLRDDVAPVALGLMLARLTSAPLLLAGAYPVDLHVDGVYPELTRAFRAEAEQGLNRFGALVEHAAGPRVPVATTVVASAGFTARALHDLAEHQEASLLVLGSSRRGLVGRVLPAQSPPAGRRAARF
jgi:nucleotide-binding universal stress UspA family protein